MSRRTRPRRYAAAEQLECRQVLSALTAMPDTIQLTLPANATSFPAVTVNVLENDTGVGLRVTELESRIFGTAELLPDAGINGMGTVRFTPGPDFRGRGSFSYVVTDANGQTATAGVFVYFDQEAAPYTWQVQTVPEVFAAAGVTSALLAPDGTPAVQIDYTGLLPASAGVLLRWEFVSGSFSGLQFPGNFTTDTSRTDAQFYPSSGGTAWITGSVDGVNAILADLDYVPARGFSATEGVKLNVTSFLYSGIGVNVATDLRSVTVRVPESALAPQAVDDFFAVRTSLEATLLDVLANDQSGVPDDSMELVDCQLGGHSQATLTIDPVTQQLVYQPPAGFIGTDVIAYTVRNAQGVEAQGRVEVNVMPPILAVLSTTPNATSVEVINAETMGLISQFEVFTRAAADAIVEVADLNNDGFMEIVVLQTSGERRMRSFNAWGGMLTDTIMRPLGSRFSGPFDLSIGDLDDDGIAELVVAGSTARGIELRAVDSSTGATEMSMMVRGMIGTPHIAVNEDSDEIVLVGRTAGGGVAMAMMDVDSTTAQQITRRTLISDRDARTLQRQNGTLTSLTLSTADLNSDGFTEAVVSMTFRNGAARIMTAGSTGIPQTMMSTRVNSGTRSLILASPSLLTENSSMIGWWSSTSIGMLDSVTTPLLRRRIVGVALG
ncbi:MAG: hypothetical protein RL215_1788 [Planctomycetota bacterium]